jgi:hypothetical protein
VTQARAKSDTVDPCAVCGWAEHMGIHTGPVSIGADPAKPHKYRPPLDVRNRMEKPDAAASLFAKAAWWLADYAELWYDIGPRGDVHDLDDTDERCVEMLAASQSLRSIDQKQASGTSANAAAIIAGMLKDWKLPGAVWFLPAAKRWRLTGDGYRPVDREVCVGIYAPGVDPALLQEDFDAVEARPLVALIGSGNG